MEGVIIVKGEKCGKSFNLSSITKLVKKVTRLLLSLLGNKPSSLSPENTAASYS